ncbi:MAG: flavodoxin, partial [Baileyella intestinalis]|nr:flavodoxin [Baileyella intestinalis]
SSLKGKKVGLFGSYGWGDGQWIRDWAERMEKAGAEVLGGEGVICNDAPDDSAKAECSELGNTLAAL